MNQESGSDKFERQLDDILDEYCSEKKIETVRPPDISNYLDMSRDYIEALPRDTRYSISIQLLQYALYLQKLHNRERARVAWSNSSITNICSSHWAEYDSFVKSDIKICLIAKENEVVKKLMKIKNNAEVRVHELAELSGYVKNIADILSRSAYGKD